MYKITLYDNCPPAFVSFTAEFFTDDLEQFEQDWFVLERDERRKERFLESKSGKIVTDHYSDDPELNIVQRDDDAKVLAEYTVIKQDVMIELINTYRYTQEIHVDHLQVVWRYILFHGKCHLIGRYHMQGVYALSWFDDGYSVQNCYGNYVLKFGWQDEAKKRKRPTDEERNNPAYYKDYEITSICWINVCEYEDVPEDLTEPEYGGEEYDVLFRDILGEAG